MSVDKNAVPAITSVKDNQGEEIHNGGVTASTSVQLSGRAIAGEKVDIFDGALSMGQTIAAPPGVWTYGLARLAVGIHSITAKGAAGTSPARAFTVTAAK